MCHKTKQLSKTKSGVLIFCQSCGVYHLTFGQFYLEFTEKELSHFGAFIDKIDMDYWENTFCSCTMQRKIPIPTQQTNLCLLLNRTELEELKRLVFFKENNKKISFIKLRHIDYDFIKN